MALSNILDDDARAVFNHICPREGRKERTDRAYFTTTRIEPARAARGIEILLELKLIDDFDGQLKLAPKCQDFVYRFGIPSDYAIELLIEERSLEREIDSGLFHQLLAEWTPETWSNAILVHEGRVIENYSGLPFLETKMSAGNWSQRKLEGRAIIISRDARYPELSIYESDRGTLDWLPLVVATRAVEVILGPRSRLSGVAQ